MTNPQTLHTAGLAVFPVNLYQSPGGRWHKKPLVEWQGQCSLNDPAWSYDTANAFGVRCPPGVIIVDVDDYKNPEFSLERDLPGDWVRALIQRTPSGGAHYAFQCPDWGRQTSKVAGFPVDTRAPGAGFIATGSGYATVGLGLLKLAAPNALPELPESLRPYLERVERERTPKIPLEGVQDDQVVEALRHVDPEERQTWWVIGCALRDIYGDEGFELFDAWSRGEFWPAGGPCAGYCSETQEQQWQSMEPNGAADPITGRSLFHLAIRGGWRPPIDRSGVLEALFGSGTADLDLYTRIYEVGSDPAQVEGLALEIARSNGSEAQKALLMSTLKAELKGAGLLDKTVARILDQAITTPSTVGRYGKSDAHNATTFLQSHYPDNTIMWCDEELYRYNGAAWRRFNPSALENQIALDMHASDMQSARVNSAISYVRRLIPVQDGVMSAPPRHLVVFSNGVFNTRDGTLTPHSPELKTFAHREYPLDWRATCPQWLTFLNEIYEGDAERIALLQEFFGLCMTTDTSFHAILVLDGVKRSGKGTISKVLEAVVGEHSFEGCGLESFTNGAFRDSLRDKLVAFVGDAEKSLRWEVGSRVAATLKSISGEDSVGFDRKWKSYWSGRLPVRLVIACNGVPELPDPTGVLPSRYKLLVHNRSFSGAEDRTLADRLLTEVEGVAAWAMWGYDRLVKNGRFTEPVACREELETVQDDASHVKSYALHTCIIDSTAECHARDLYQPYLLWCAAEGVTPLNQPRFTGQLKDTLRERGVRYVKSIKIRGSTSSGFRGIAPCETTCPTEKT